MQTSSMSSRIRFRLVLSKKSLVETKRTSMLVTVLRLMNFELKLRVALLSRPPVRRKRRAPLKRRRRMVATSKLSLKSSMR